MTDGTQPPSAPPGARRRPLARRAARRLLQIVRDSYRYVAFPMRFSDSRGVFDSLEQAVAAAPRGKPIGYDDPALAREYADNLRLELADYDYPFLFHLEKILGEIGRPCTVLDFGGSVGVHYLKYRKYLDLERVSWIVCDVPSIAERGREVCEDQDKIIFISDVSQAGPVDIVLAVGSVQYVDDFVGALEAADILPRCILIGQVLLHDKGHFVTLQNGGRVYYPQYVFNSADFIASFEASGYTLIDAWNDTSNGCVIPFHPELEVVSKGLYFAL